jgi:unsaturated rhamnogalacturonyl hydrolase
MLRYVIIWLVVAACSLAIAADEGTRVVGLDCYHNNETGPHYNWEQKDMGGFSQLGELLKTLEADIANVKETCTAQALAPLSMLIIVDPDTPKEAKAPNYIVKEEADALETWVKAGGVLVLMGNNTGNAEFTHLNGLANRFGITFNEDTATTNGPKIDKFPDSPLFAGVSKLHIVGMCTLKVAGPAQAVLSYNNQVLMATATLGKGTVFAVGDPWLYNEYINHEQNRVAATNIFRTLLQVATPVPSGG